ncbi:MAG: biliverdin-producing heme oxygenase [Myxococcota bacterium]
MTLHSAVPLTQHLRRATRRAHSRVRVIPMMRAFFGGRLGPRVVMEALCALREVYRALEAQLLEHDVVAHLHRPELVRASRLDADLEGLLGHGWPAPSGPHPGALAYADRIRSVARQAPLLLGAHAYARYLGDLAGGPIAQRAVPFVLKLPAGFRFAYLEHPEIDDVREYRRTFRATLDALPVPRRQPMVDEVLEAFQLHESMMGELLEA